MNPTYEVEMKNGDIKKFPNELEATRFLMRYENYIRTNEVRMVKSNGRFEVRFLPHEFLGR